jgi:ribosomal protein L11 methyltransferase
MKYHVAHIETSFEQEWQADIFTQQLCELGFDTFESPEDPSSPLIMQAYIPSDQWEAHGEQIRSLCAATAGVQLRGVEACPDENWNAVWEAEHTIQELPLGIRIIPHCAFGAGHHETTSMMVNALLEIAPRIRQDGFRVLDHGTGTGILAIFAKASGAAQVTAVDIDEKSVANARENAALNNADIEVMHTSDFAFGPNCFDLILANIHRNILMDHMPAYAAALKEKGELWLSGFYESDCPTLIAAAQAQGLAFINRHAANEWRMLQFRKG